LAFRRPTISRTRERVKQQRVDLRVVFNRLKSLFNGARRRLAEMPIGLLPRRQRAQALEILSNEMIFERDVPCGTLKFFAPTPLLQDRAATVLTKEPDMIRWIDRLGPRSVLWDIGANVGVFSLYAGVHAKCTVLCFEPSAANFYVLSRNIHLNRLNHFITAYCIALAGSTELGVLNLTSEDMGGAMSQFGKQGEMSHYWSGEGKSAIQGMVGFTVDDFIARFSPPFPTHLKMDVDGLEWSILQGATRTLGDSRLRAAMVELSLSNPGERDQAIALLQTVGLSLVSQGETQGTETGKAANHLFERRGR
jgi:FkbM family methyltransferase